MMAVEYLCQAYLQISNGSNGKKIVQATVKSLVIDPTSDERIYILLDDGVVEGYAIANIGKRTLEEWHQLVDQKVAITGMFVKHVKEDASPLLFAYNIKVVMD